MSGASLILGIMSLTEGIDRLSDASNAPQVAYLHDLVILL